MTDFNGPLGSGREVFLNSANEGERVKNQGIIYLICFKTPLHHARHYMGFTQDLERRFDRHLRGDGSALLRAVVEAGIEFSIVRTWQGDRNLERALKRQKQGPKLCPVCNPKVSVVNE